MKDGLELKGVLHYELFDEVGALKEEDTITNTVTDVMDAHIADQLSDGGDATIGFIALGSGTGQTASSTDLANYVAASLIALSGTGPEQGTGGNDNDVIYYGYWGAGVATNAALTEAGVFRESGTSRTTLSLYNDALSINKGASDTLKVTWTLTCG